MSPTKPAAKRGEKSPDARVEGKREKLTITKIREAKKTGEKEGLNVAGLHLGKLG